MSRKPLETPNELWEFLRFICDKSVDGIPSWVDDYVVGACYTSGGISKGKLNINPSYVRRAIFLKTISTDTCRNIYSLDQSISERTAQRIAKATRFALGGIQRHLENKDKETSFMKNNWKMEQQFIWCYKHNVPSKLYSSPAIPIPEEIESLYREGKYVEYGRKLMEFRRE